ncbi:PEGA domain-containing protein [Fibrobacter sp. UBA3629]|uniref:PEGA domain-containing protein n=1 Tax=Fibrobacter sp. UBA3629 TaxID=1946530 RepID=UPI0025C5601C|nr:PEGA domain-containing protein [Fibrobacter sp. UBA3629]
MNRLIHIFLVLAFFTGASFAKHVAVLETVSDTKDLLSPSERIYLTNTLREEAVKELPAELEYTIMTRENIQEMLPPGKAIEDCEGSCLVETGKNISADYICQARVGKVGSKFSISTEIYETSTNKLVASFNGLGADVEALIEVIMAKAPEFFRKVRGGAKGIIRTGFDGAGNQSFAIHVSTNPPGAALSIDGRPVPKCNSTPCQILLESGRHRFLAVLDHYEDAEGSFDITGNGQQVSLDLVPRFGTLVVEPQLNGGGTLDELEMTLDGNKVKAGKIELDPGVHSVELSHRCYNPASFKVGIYKGKEETFRDALVPIPSGIALSASKPSGELLKLPVFVNDAPVGETPYLGSVPLCSKVEIGEGATRTALKLDLVAGETTEYEYTVPENGGQGKVSGRKRRGGAARPDVSTTPTTSTTPPKGTSVPTNVPSSSSSSWSLVDHAAWLLPVSAVLAGAGLAMGIVFNIDAEEQYKSATADNYKENMDAAKQSQMLRNIGWVLTGVGGFGFILGTTFLIIDF